MKLKVYISGQITGIEEHAPELFGKAEQLLKEKGFDTINPVALPHLHDKAWCSYMKEDIKALCDCDIIFMLGNWQNSKGATIERQIAQQLGLKVMYQEI